MTIGAGVLLAVVLAVVFALGWVCGQVHAERAAELTAVPVPVRVSAGRHAAGWPRYLDGPRVLLETAELEALLYVPPEWVSSRSEPVTTPLGRVRT